MRGEQLDLSWQFQRAFVVFNGRLESKVLLDNFTRLHQQSMLIFATIALGHPKLALEPFQ